MISRKLEKNLIFFNPGQAGAIFTYETGNKVDFDMIDSAITHLEYETENDVVCIEDRREKSRKV
jgi:hypothetical protein